MWTVNVVRRVGSRPMGQAGWAVASGSPTSASGHESMVDGGVCASAYFIRVATVHACIILCMHFRKIIVINPALYTILS